MIADVDAIVLALKSRNHLPRYAGCKPRAHSRFISNTASPLTARTQGNIGPATEVLMGALSTEFTIATPAFPDNKRTVFKGYMFAGDTLLNESGMQNHPLTPMLDDNLVRVLQALGITQMQIGPQIAPAVPRCF